MKRIISFAAFIILTFVLQAYSASKITVFTIPGCSKCAYMINYLKNNNIQYSE